MSRLEARLVSGTGNVPDVSFSHVVVSDLMSDVLVVEEDDYLLLTSLSGEQVIRTADITGARAVLLCNGKTPPAGMIRLADEHGIPLLCTPLRTFELCRRIVHCQDARE